MSRDTLIGPLGQTVQELGINYLVAEDSDRDTWAAYGMRVYPSWAFINPDGSLGGRGVGKVTNEQVQQLIEQAVTA